MSRLLAVLGCLCAVAALAHSAAVPTQDTMVVAKSDDTVSFYLLAIGSSLAKTFGLFVGMRQIPIPVFTSACILTMSE